MQSPGAWTNVPFPAHQQSYGSSSGGDAFSLISANTELGETSYSDLDTISNMAVPLASEQNSSETFPPVTPGVVDWVQEQSQDDQPSNGATGLQHARLEETTPCGGQGETNRAKVDEHGSRQEARQPAKKIYDIATLLRLKETQSKVPVMLRVKPEAIAENIFQYMGATTSRRQPTRSTGLSDTSNVSTANGDSHSHIIYPVARPKYMTQPVRQPHPPPETSILQRHDGFARFLKQHASPPHHRVTAGGRIVPAGPSSPPPMLDFGSLNGLLQNRPATTKFSQIESRSNQTNARAQNPQTTSSMTLGDYLQSQSGSADGMNLQHAPQPSPVQTAISFNNAPFGYQSFMAPAMQTQAPMVPLGFLPDGSALVSYNGMSYRASWNGMSMNMEPLQLPLDQQYYPQVPLPGYLNNFQHSVVPQLSQGSVPSAPLANATNIARPDASKSDLFLEHEGQNGDELSLKAKLTNLDKHLALYHYDITPADRTSLIAQRRYLVEEIDRIRLSKDKPKHSIPIIAPPAPGLPVTPAAQPISGPNGLREAVHQDSKAKGTISKHLSPAAPPFVPRNISDLPSTSFGMRTASQQSKHEQFGTRAPYGGIDLAPKAKDNGKSSAWTNQSDRKASFKNAQKVLRTEESSSYSVLDPSDPAMRVIEYEDIEYAARYLYNWTKDAKTYCTTVAEFQEAIRRVREQARLYGCAGGQSKDPAYDAEQDLWWAICDRDPIPLSSKVPDHVANPRPWNWNDSAFNYRRQEANDAPGPGYEQARNSPRVLGWDVVTTDKMKNSMDVSRSYFALKGRLPSVSFRDFAYDRVGNKRLIQSDTAASTAYATAPKDTAYSGPLPTAGFQQNPNGLASGSGARMETSTSELDIQRTSSIFDDESKSVDGDQAPESVSLPPQGVPCTPEPKRIQQPLEESNVHPTMQISKTKLFTGQRITKSKNSESTYGHHHAYIEDYPETPVVGGIKSASKGVLTPLTTTTPSTALIDPLLKDKIDARAEPSVQTKFSDGDVQLDPSWKPTDAELDSIWYHTPLDEVTQKYLDDMKAYNPFNNNQPDGENQGVDGTKKHSRTSDSSEPMAESKSPWGPEEGTTPMTPSGHKHSESPEVTRKAKESGVAKTAKVKIPSASTLRAPIARINGNHKFSTGFNVLNTLDSREVNAINVPTIESHDSHNFLRKMLKSPRFSSAQPINTFNQITSTLADKINWTKRASAISPDKKTETKGITHSYKYGKPGCGQPADSRPLSSASLTKVDPNSPISKAQSSLASSTYQAHGYLPQFDGAGKAHTSSVYREQGIQPLPQVRLPSESLYGDRQHAAGTSYNHNHSPSTYTATAATTTYHNPIKFGYDGGTDSPPPKSKVDPQVQQSGRPAFDFMGVTLADYEHHRGDTNNKWHQGAVDDFFQDLREQELREIASHQRINR